ncbi:hypothetical protein HYR99_27385 [Candidatus Poribacteria bacterium]|nr:hypothetical protein [Candidatus Poribacteria bacterium]
MTNREHCAVTKLFLGIEPQPEMHSFMDGYSRSAGWSPKRGRLDFKIAHFMEELYGLEGGLEAALHIACDLKLITKRDVDIWKAATLPLSGDTSSRRTARQRSAFR